MIFNINFLCNGAFAYRNRLERHLLDGGVDDFLLKEKEESWDASLKSAKRLF